MYEQFLAWTVMWMFLIFVPSTVIIMMLIWAESLFEVIDEASKRPKRR